MKNIKDLKSENDSLKAAISRQVETQLLEILSVENKIKPCPFCNGIGRISSFYYATCKTIMFSGVEACLAFEKKMLEDKKLASDTKRDYWIYCMACGATRNNPKPSVYSAVRVWNDRTPFA